MHSFSVKTDTCTGRIGKLSLNSEIQTPFLFPVAFLMTGTTARGGATWKYVLQANLEHGLLRRNSPVLSQVLHFLDYNVSPNSLQTWRMESIRGLYNKQHVDLNYTAPIFLDSGGFKLMWRTGLDLQRYGISLKAGEEAESILKLQRDLGGDIIATLDYPLPPNLRPVEALERMDRSRKNAIQAAILLHNNEEFRDYNPFLYMAVHGLTPEAISDYVQRLFAQIESQDLGDSAFGLAIGSLVPLRSAKKTSQIIALVRHTVKNIPSKYKNQVPLHVFGVTGLLVPYLAYCGIDTFDSSTFAQEVRSLKYLFPDTFQRRNVLDMSQKDIVCKCRICQDMDLDELQSALVSETIGKPLANGHFKSKYYADLALHNLELDLTILKMTREAIESAALDDYVIEIARKAPRMKDALEALTEFDQDLKSKASRVIHQVSKKIRTTTTTSYISLAYGPEDFDINANGYKPSGHKPVMLIIPCSRGKPYSVSQSHNHLSTYLEQSFPSWQNVIDKVTLSGLFGPVPVIYESEEPVLHYDFRLISNNFAQTELCVQRLVEFLQRNGKYYTHCVAYGTSNAYRTVFEKAARQYDDLVIFPEQPKSRTLREFYRIKNISELIEYLQDVLNVGSE